MIFTPYKKLAILLGAILVCATSCFKDLDTVPLDKDEVTAATVYEDPAAYRKVLGKLYTGLAVSGQQGPSGKADIAGIDEGFGQYLRGMWYHQEFTTDEAVVGWADQTIKDFHEQDWTSNDVFISAFYSRIFYQVAVCNEFLRETTDDKLNSRGVDAGLQAEIQTYKAEARFLRALSYWHALDLFRNVPFVTEEDKVGSFFPRQINPQELYDFIESELKAIEGQLIDARQNEYGRADKAAAWMLLAKLYLNAEVYVGKDANSACIEYTSKIINSGFSLEPVYTHLFMADNHISDEIIFPIPFDGVLTKTWGGTTFLVNAPIGGSMNPADFGVNGGWAGVRTTSALVNKFPAVAGDSGGGFIVSPQTGEAHAEIFVPGNFVRWDPAKAPAIASPDSNGVYEGYLYFEDDRGQFKITTERSFDVNYGDNDEDGTLDANGSNIKVSEPGFYRLSVDLNNLTYELTKTEWAIVGDATENGWDVDTKMTFDSEENAWVVETFLNAGKMKFRANSNWDINFGDDGADALLDAAGADIVIANKSNYRVKLYLDKPDYTYSLEITSSDSRATFYTDGQSLEIADIAQFTEGYAVKKFMNINRDGSNGSDLTHSDCDFPMFRLADAYLMYAEAVARGGQGGDRATAVSYINEIRERAYGDNAGNIDDAELTLPFLLDERARELFWEAHRRTDLVRFGQFSNGDYSWPWKGGVAEGKTVSEHFDIFPIPSSDIGANPNLDQNDGY